MFDYIIVGLGLSGLTIAEELEKREKNFLVFDDSSQKSSYVAGGIYNPVILKRFTPAWRADEQLKRAIPFYKELENKLEIRFVHSWNIYRRLHSVEEQNDWIVASDNPRLAPFMESKLVKNTNPNLKADHFLGKVIQTGNIDTGTLLDAYRAKLISEKKLLKEKFEYADVIFHDDFIQYNDIKAKQIIFCEGFGLKKNPWFGYLPLRGNKGEYITVYSEALKLDFAVKSSVFIIPMGNDLYKVGATYDHQDKTQRTTPEAREKLTKQLKEVINCDFEVVDQSAGIRPAVADRRPVVGSHPEKEHLYCCNGFGSRGVLIAPQMAKDLISHIEDGKELDVEIDLRRFTSKHYRS